jgi:hypothetical protein
MRRELDVMQIARGRTEDFTCGHCGAGYEVSETPAHDSGSAECEVCNTIMMQWADSAIPLFRPKEDIEDARRRYFFHSQYTIGQLVGCK